MANINKPGIILHPENIKILVGLLFIVLLGLYLSHWWNCHMDTKFFFSSLDLKLRIIFDIRSDENVSLSVARLLHNKGTQGSVDIFNAYMHFWDIRFLLLLLSPLGLFGLFSWIYFTVKKQLQILLGEKIIVICSLLMPVIILFNVIKNQHIALMLFALPLAVLALRGLLAGKKNSKHYMIYMLITVVCSLWYVFFLSNALVNFCHL